LLPEAVKSGRGYCTAGKWRLPTEERCKINEKKVREEQLFLQPGSCSCKPGQLQWPGLTKQQARESSE